MTTSSGSIDLAGLPLADLEAELATLASHLYAGTCRWLELVAELDRRARWAEEDLLGLASHCTASQLERSVRAHGRVTTEEAREQQDGAHLNVFWNPDGSLEIHGRLAPEDGALLLRALESTRDSLWRGSAEPRLAGAAATEWIWLWPSTRC